VTYLPLVRFAGVPVIASLVLVLTTQFASADNGRDNFADMAEKLLPAVVSIETLQNSTDTNSKDPSLQELLKQFFDHQTTGAAPGPRRQSR
jgi:serine protease Do